ncbi:MAG TPA: hypothetical protein VFJ17_00915 [Mycobacteriales bacterium]|jgi:hypothetical protein|nr:hypothetical protein [Mycobacteriales bacterium]
MPSSSAARNDYEPVPRCCQRHRDWATLAQHVCDSFPDLSVAEITRELRVAREALEMCDVGDDALVIAELIARHRLMVASGQVSAVAILDPQTHSPRT